MNRLIDFVLSCLIALLDRTGKRWKTPVGGFLLAGTLALHHLGVINDTLATYLYGSIGAFFGLGLIHRAVRVKGGRMERDSESL